MRNLCRWTLPGLTCVLTLAACVTGGYRQARLTQPAQTLTRTFEVEVSRVYVNEDTVLDGVGDGTALVVELDITNRGAKPYQLNPGQIWCLLQIDARHPDQTRMFPPSVSGPGEFTGYPPDTQELPDVDVPPGETRKTWVLFRGYRFADSDVPWKVTLTLPDPEGNSVEVVLADPSNGYLRWTVPPTRSTFDFGVQERALYGGYAQVNVVGTRLARMARAGRFLWDIGLVSSTFVQVKGALRSTSSSFGATGFDAHLAMPLFRWGDPAYPVRLGPFIGAEAQLLIATQAAQVTNPPTIPPIYGEIGPEVGLEVDVGALRLARTPFPLVAETRYPVPRWLFRVGYTHTWIGHGTTDGYLTSFRIAW